MTALRVYGRTILAARLGYFLLFRLRQAAARFADSVQFLGTIGGA